MKSTALAAGDDPSAATRPTPGGKPGLVPDAPARKAVFSKRFPRALDDREQRAFAARIKAITEGSRDVR